MRNIKRYISIRIFLVLLIVSVLTGIVSAQQYGFRNYSIEHGLAQSQVTAICQDEHGYLWIGTNGGGLVKFDGINYKVYKIKQGLNGNKVSSLCYDSQKQLWVGFYEGGLSKFDGEKFTNFKLPEANSSVLCIVEDKHQHIWIGTEQDGLFTWNGKGFVKIKTNEINQNDAIQAINFLDSTVIIGTRNNGVFVLKDNIYKPIEINKKTTENKVNCIGLPQINYQSWLMAKSINSILIVNDTIWIGTETGLFGIKRKNYFYEIVCFRLNKQFITNIIKDNNDILWIGTFGDGLYRINKQDLIHFGEKEGLIAPFINVLYVDDANNLWIGSDGNGLFRFKGERFRYFNTTFGLTENVIMSIFQDSKGRYWFGTFGKGLSCFDGEKFTHYTSKNGLSDDVVYDIVEDKENNLWISTRNGGICKFNGKNFQIISTKHGLPSSMTNSLAIDAHGNIWVAMKTAGIACYTDGKFINFNKNDGLKSIKVQTIFIDSKGKIWFGTDAAGLYNIKAPQNNYNLNKSDFTITKIEYFDTLHSTISSICEDKTGNIWIGTQGSGVFRYNGKDFKNYNTDQGLMSDHIYSMIFDNDDNLWVGSEKGVDKLTFWKFDQLIKVNHFSKDEGFVGIETNLNAVCKDNLHRLLFGTINGVMVYNPNADAPYTHEPKILLTELLLFFEKPKWEYVLKKPIQIINNIPQNPIFPYNKNHLTFKFIGIDLSFPEKVTYQWKLEGFDDDWSPRTDNNEVTYSNIPPGKYVFKVKSYNSNGISNKYPLEYAFEILTPFWKTWWFYVLLIVFVIALIIIIMKLRVRTLKLEKRELEEMVDLRTEELQLEKENVQRARDKVQEQNEVLNSLNITLQKQKETLLKQSQELAEEKQKSDALLLNILPQEIANELKIYGKASVKHHERVSVLFSDIIGFTKISESISREELITALDECFRHFDEIVEKYGLEKIKTIGDAYMCAGGINKNNDAEHIKTVLAGLEFQDWIKKMNEKNFFPSQSPWNIRVGIHTGKVIAGVVGKKKFAFDIWGRAVNTASRIESASEAGKVNISANTYNIVKDYFNCVSRGMIEVKNAQIFEMYFIESIKVPYADALNNYIPNNAFITLLNRM